MMLWSRQRNKVGKISQMIVNDIDVQIVRKKIKNLHLRVYPDNAGICVAVPLSVNDDEVRRVVLEKLGWIRRQQLRLAKRPVPVIYKMVSGESHYYLGETYSLNVIERHGKHELLLSGNSELLLYVRPGTCADKRTLVLTEWYRQQIKAVIPGLIEKWEPIIGVTVDDWGIKKMKTRWGTCNIMANRIWLNLELVKKPMDCLEYVLVHEMVHLLERYHNKNFRDYMDSFMPDWRLHEDVLKCEPLLR